MLLMRALLAFVVACAAVSHTDFPEDMVWGAATAAYQVEVRWILFSPPTERKERDGDGDGERVHMRGLHEPLCCWLAMRLRRRKRRNKHSSFSQGAYNIDGKGPSIWDQWFVDHVASCTIRLSLLCRL